MNATLNDFLSLLSEARFAFALGEIGAARRGDFQKLVREFVRTVLVEQGIDAKRTSSMPKNMTLGPVATARLADMRCRLLLYELQSCSS